MRDRDIELLARMVAESAALDSGTHTPVSVCPSLRELSALVASGRQTTHTLACVKCRARVKALRAEDAAVRVARPLSRRHHAFAAAAAAIAAVLLWPNFLRPAGEPSVDFAHQAPGHPVHHAGGTPRTMTGMIALMPEHPLALPSTMEGKDLCVACDANCDGVVNTLDVEAFALAVLKPEIYAREFAGCDAACRNDMNCDGAVNRLDIEPFLACVMGS